MKILAPNLVCSRNQKLTNFIISLRVGFPARRCFIFYNPPCTSREARAWTTRFLTKLIFYRRPDILGHRTLTGCPLDAKKLIKFRHVDLLLFARYDTINVHEDDHGFSTRERYCFDPQNNCYIRSSGETHFAREIMKLCARSGIFGHRFSNALSPGRQPSQQGSSVYAHIMLPAEYVMITWVGISMLFSSSIKILKSYVPGVCMSCDCAHSISTFCCPVLPPNNLLYACCNTLKGPK